MSILILAVICPNGNVFTHPKSAGNLKDLILNKIHPKVKDTLSKLLLTNPDYDMFCLKENEIYFYCAAEKLVPKKQIWWLLREISEEFSLLLCENTGSVDRMLVEKIVFVSDPENRDIMNLKAKVENSKQIEIENMALMLAKDENLHEIVLNPDPKTVDPSKMTKWEKIRHNVNEFTKKTGKVGITFAAAFLITFILLMLLGGGGMLLWLIISLLGGADKTPNGS